MMLKVGKRYTKISIKDLFKNSLDQLKNKFESAKIAHKTHLPSQGDLIEKDWITILSTYLPERYKVSNGFVIDSDSSISKQIDIIVYDKQYSQFVYKEEDHFFIPIEAVYAIFECKSTLNKSEYDDAIEKYNSVKRLLKSYTTIKHVNGLSKSKPNRILFGLLSAKSQYSTFDSVLSRLDNDGICDFIVIVDKGIKCNRYNLENKKCDIIVDINNPLFAFIYLLNDQLQTLGTVGAMNFYDYYCKNK